MLLFEIKENNILLEIIYSNTKNTLLLIRMQFQIITRTIFHKY